MKIYRIVCLEGSRVSVKWFLPLDDEHEMFLKSLSHLRVWDVEKNHGDRHKTVFDYCTDKPTKDECREHTNPHIQHLYYSEMRDEKLIRDMECKHGGFTPMSKYRRVKTIVLVAGLQIRDSCDKND